MRFHLRMLDGDKSTASASEPLRGEDAEDKTPVDKKSEQKRQRSKKFDSLKKQFPARKDLCCFQRPVMLTSIDDLKSLRFWKAVNAELVGTLLLVFIGCSSCIDWADDEKASVVQIALCFGIAVTTIVWILGHVSGGHINPAITLALFVCRRVSLARACFYIIAQIVGGIIGAALVYGVTPSELRGKLGSTLVQNDLHPGKAFGVEFIITFILVLTVFASSDKKRTDLRGSIPLAIGLAVVTCHLGAVRFTGAGMNIARSFGPAVIMGTWDNHWVYWVGPVLGGLMAGVLYENLFASNASITKARAFLLTSDYDDGKYVAHGKKIRILRELDPDGDGDADVSTRPFVIHEETRETIVLDESKASLAKEEETHIP